MGFTVSLSEPLSNGPFLSGGCLPFSSILPEPVSLDCSTAESHLYLPLLPLILFPSFIWFGLFDFLGFGFLISFCSLLFS